MSGSHVYWLCPETTEVQARRAAILDEIGYEVSFFHNLELLAKEVCSKRAQILILGDAWDSRVTLQCIQLLASLPEINGARLILSHTAHSDNRDLVLEAAMSQGFRDLIPESLSDADWLRRFEFSTSGLASILEPHEVASVPQETLNLFVPARLVWIGAQQLWLECRGGPQIGETIYLQGPLVESLGLKELEVQVQQRLHTHLSYRFSEALIGNWYRSAVEHADPQKILDTLDHLAEIDLGPRPRIFLAIQSPALRTTVGKYLDRRRYEVHTALQQNSLLYEPKYFSPDLVFIEDRLMMGEHRRNFHELLRFLPDHTVVVSIGGKEDSTQIKSLGASRQLRFLKNIPHHLNEIIERDYLANLSSRKISLFDLRKVHCLPNEELLSCASIRIEAELCRMDGQQVEFQCTHNIGHYSLMAACSPLLEKTVGGRAFMKVIAKEEISEGEVRRYYFKAHLCNQKS